MKALPLRLVHTQSQLFNISFQGRSNHQHRELQGGHGTGKTGNSVLTFSRQGKHREFCFDTGKNSETQGKYLTVIIKIKSMFIFLNFKIF